MKNGKVSSCLVTPFGDSMSSKKLIVDIRCLELGIIPSSIHLGVALMDLSPEDRRKARRKFRKLHRKARKKLLKSIDKNRSRSGTNGRALRSRHARDMHADRIHFAHSESFGQIGENPSQQQKTRRRILVSREIWEKENE